MNPTAHQKICSQLEAMGVSKAYLGCLKLSSSAGRWVCQTLNRHFGWSEEALGSITYLTEFPPELLPETVDVLLAELYPTGGKDPKAGYPALKKLGYVLKAYQKLLAPAPQPAGEIQQGPFCFSFLLDRWLDARGERAPMDRWLRNLFEYAAGDGVSPEEVPQNILVGTALSQQDRDAIFSCLMDVRRFVEEDENDAEGGLLEPRDLSRRLQSLHFELRQDIFRYNLPAFTEYFAAKDGCPPGVAQELYRLQVLETYWPSLGPRRRVLLAQIMLSLLASSLSAEPVEDFSTPLDKEERLIAKLCYCALRSGGTLTDELVHSLKKRCQTHLLFDIPASPWTQEELAALRKDPLLLSQLLHLAGEAPRILNLPAAGASSWDARRSAASMLLTALQQSLRPPIPPQAEKELLSIARSLLRCYGVFRPAEKSNIHHSLMTLQNPRLSLLQSDADQYQISMLQNAILEISAANNGYLTFLTDCAQLKGWQQEEKLLLQEKITQVTGMLSIAGSGLLQPKASLQLPAAKAKILTPPGSPAECGEFRRPFVCSTFDSAARAAAADIQLKLGSVLLCSGRVVLLGPQISDNPQVLSLVGDRDFLRLLACGAVTFSTFNGNRTLKDYVLGCFQPGSKFSFSGYRLFQEEDRDYLHSCVYAYLCAEDHNGRQKAAGRFPISAYAEAVNYCDSIRLFDEALSAQRTAGGILLRDHYHQVQGWMGSSLTGADLLGGITRHIAALKDGPHRQELQRLHREVLHFSPTWLDAPRKVTRSEIHKAIETILGQSMPELLRDYRFITATQYFSCTTDRVTPYKDHAVSAGFAHLRPVTGGEAWQETFSRQTPAQDLSDAFSMETLADFSEEAEKWVRKGGSRRAADILGGVLQSGSAEVIGPSFANFSFRVKDPISSHVTVLDQQADPTGNSGQWNEAKF